MTVRRSPANVRQTPPHTPAEAADPLGHDLLADRLARIPKLLVGLARNPLGGVSAATRNASHFVVTGTGSSEAHARFLTYLLNRHAGRSAEFVPLSAFCTMPAGFGKGRALIVVSQGLSPNAQVGLDRHGDFEHAIVFTSTTAAGAAAAGKPDRAERIRALEAAGVEFVRSPLEEEYSTLIRFIGPLAVYVRAWQFAGCITEGSLPPLDPGTLEGLLRTRASNDVVTQFATHAGDFRRGFYLLAGSPLCEFAHNLSYKFLEGLYWSAPVIWDYLQFAHGPFQEVSLQPRPVVLLQGPGPVEGDLTARTQRMLTSAGVPCIHLAITPPPPLSIIAWEALFNDLVFRLIRKFGVDQRNWPSKGRDDPLYGFYRVG